MKKHILVMGNGMISQALIKALIESEINASTYDACVKGFKGNHKACISHQENKWRGGSRGKGGKTKWPKR